MKHISTFKYMSFTAHIVPDVWLPFGKMYLFPPPHSDFLRALAFKTRQKGRWERRAVPEVFLSTVNTRKWWGQWSSLSSFIWTGQESVWNWTLKYSKTRTWVLVNLGTGQKSFWKINSTNILCVSTICQRLLKNGWMGRWMDARMEGR